MQVYKAPDEIPAPDFGTFFKPGGGFDNDAYAKDEQRYIDAVCAWALEHGEPHDVAGKVVHVPYADGAAYYVPFKRGVKVSLIHLAVGDAWSDPRFERLCTVAELRRMIAQDERLAAFHAERVDRG